MTPQQEAAMRQALEAMVYFADGYGDPVPALEKIDAAITALRRALESHVNETPKSEHEQQSAVQFAGSYGTIDESAAKRIATALGWEPKREWVGLTDEEIGQTLGDAKVTELPNGYEMVDLEIARAIEQRLKEKNT